MVAAVVAVAANKKLVSYYKALLGAVADGEGFEPSMGF